jgi:hypothetical protein
MPARIELQRNFDVFDDQAIMEMLAATGNSESAKL